LLDISVLLPLVITMLLFVGCYHDIKTKTVSNKITGTIILLSIPLIYFNIDNIGISNYVYSGVLLLMYYVGTLGGADFKVLVPIVFAVPALKIFLLALGIMGILYWLTQYAISRRSNSVPYFVPISCAYAGVMLLV